MAAALLNSVAVLTSVASSAADARASVVRSARKGIPTVRMFDKRFPFKTMALANENGEGRVAVDRRQHVQNSTPAPSRSQGKRDVSPSRTFDLWDPFAPPSSSLAQMLRFMDDFVDDNLTISGQNRGVKDRRTPWDVIEDKETFSLRIDMPGLDKEDVKVSVEDGSLVVKGEKLQAEGKEQDKWTSRSYGIYNYRVALPEKVRTEQIKAELKNGVLYITVPKLAEESKSVDIQVS